MPEIRNIYSIVGNGKGIMMGSYRANEAYKSYVGNEWMMYHGTKRTCLIGEETMLPCTERDCTLCSILARGFDISKAGANNRYGKGIYTTPISSKADDYASSTKSECKCVLWTSVTLGRVQGLPLKWDSRIMCPGYGYDSILGLTKSQGGVLNYPEYVVYRDEAVRLKALIVYA